MHGARVIARTIWKSLWLWVHQKPHPWGMIYVAPGLGDPEYRCQTYMTMLLKRKAPHLSILTTHKVPPTYCHIQGRWERMTSLLALERASSGWGPLHQGRHHLPADWDCGVMITCDCIGMLSSVLWLAI